MASATTLLRRSSAGVAGCGRQIYCHFLSGASKQSHIIIPTAISSIRQFASSTSPKYNEAFVKDLLSKLHDMQGEIEMLRKQKELLTKSKEEEIGSVKRKHPILKEIESEMSKPKFTSKDKKYFCGFQITSESSWRFTVNLERSLSNELICLQISKPNCGIMPLIVEFGFPGFFGKQIEFRCFVRRYGCCKIDKIKYRAFHKGVAFDELPENVQREFHTYLESKGLNSRTRSSLYEYMLNKISKKHLTGIHNKFQRMLN